MSPTVETKPPLLKESEAARYLNVEVATLRRWRWAGKGPGFVKLGSSVRYEQAHLEAFVTAGRRLSTSDRGAEG